MISIETAIASDWPRSSAPTPGCAPGVSIRTMRGRENLSASFISRWALRYPSGRAMPKLCLMRPSVSRPFSWPMITTGCPEKRPRPPISAPSSPKTRSPARGVKSVINPFTYSEKWGRSACRETNTFCHGVSFA